MDEKRFDVDPKWAENLERLPMAVPEYWWVGFTSRTRCFGKNSQGELQRQQPRLFLSRAQFRVRHVKYHIKFRNMTGVRAGEITKPMGTSTLQ